MKKKLIIVITIIVLLVIGIYMALTFFKTPKTDELKGLWDIDGNTKYEFDGKGKGKLIIPSTDYVFSYEINDNILSIDFENEESIDSEFKYNLNSDTLEITNTKDNLKYILKKVNK